MILAITFKDPDGVSNSLDEAVLDSIPASITDLDERDALLELRLEKAKDGIREWVSFGEYVTIEIDTEAGTAIVKKARD